MVPAWGMPLVLLLALWIDHRFGEPPVAIHPVVWMGRYLQVCGQITVRCPPALAFALGTLAWWVGAGVVVAAAWLVQSFAFWLLGRATTLVPGAAWHELAPAVGGALMLGLMAWATKSMLSWRMLHDEAGAVEAALQQSLPAGRERLSMLVSRDTALLSEREVRESTLETLAENLNDSVVAPIFWFILLGLPGAALYRFANTADAMWGYRGSYKGQHWEWAGKWAARADDVLSWLPARLTALLLMGVTGHFSITALRREAIKTPSPNSGWPMAAMALALGVTLSKPGVYTLNATGRAPGSTDLVLAQKYASKVVCAQTACALVAIISVAVLW
jgi:adenosylcobinamide-phosphate synthase